MACQEDLHHGDSSKWFCAGAAVRAFSRSCDAWVDATVVEMEEDNRVKVEYEHGGCRCIKSIDANSEHIAVSAISSPGCKRATHRRVTFRSDDFLLDDMPTELPSIDSQPNSSHAKPRRGRPKSLHEDTMAEQLGSKSWALDSMTGAMEHFATGMRVTPDSGIQCNGREYNLTEGDVEFLGGAPMASGASGSVWLGRIKTTGMPVAIKTLKTYSSDERRLILNEVQTLIEAEGCPYLVQWHAGFTSPTTRNVHLVLELMDHGSLACLNLKTGIPAGILAAMASQVLQGLRHLHSLQLLHNDIKPGNILLSRHGDVKISDFGITMASESSDCDACLGTQMYVAPEKALAASGNGYSCPADIWSFGIVCFELVACRHPFASASSVPEIFNLLLNEPEPRLFATTEQPAALCDFVACCLEREASERWTAEELLAHSFMSTASTRDELRDWVLQNSCRILPQN